MKNKTDTRLIEQRFDNDCGIAALAMLVGISYEHSSDLVLKAGRKPFDGTTSDHARRLGRAVGQPLKVWYVSAKNRETVLQRLKKRPAVLVVPAQDYASSGDWHALYWTGSRVLDPSPVRKYGARGAKALKLLREVWVIA